MKILLTLLVIFNLFFLGWAVYFGTLAAADGNTGLVIFHFVCGTIQFIWMICNAGNLIMELED